MDDKTRVIDGTQKALKAPRPPHTGLMQAVYDVIKALDGANLKQIKEYLPAAIQKYNQVTTEKRIKKSLYNGVYWGYLIKNSREYYFIAPLDYYEVRQAHLERLRTEQLKRRMKKSHKHVVERTGEDILYVRPLWHWIVLAAVAVGAAAPAFLIGFLCGVYLV